MLGLVVVTGGAGVAQALNRTYWLTGDNPADPARLLCGTKTFTTAFYVLLSGDNKYLPNLITICFTTP